MSRKDKFKNGYQTEMAATNLDCPQLYHPKWRGKAKKQLRKMARKRLKDKLIDEFESQQLKFYLICYYEDINDDNSCIDEMQTKDYDFVKSYIGHNSYKVFAVYEDGLMDELYKIKE